MQSNFRDNMMPGDPGLQKALDVMNELFTNEYLETICERIKYFMEKRQKSSKPIEFETDEERFFLMLDEVVELI